ncbi:hypothetical protein SAMN05880590_102526 [Rhizobium sp. RU35A]|uniref:hypothetical protein n=1 Tax=Rhizobium sp. RU35A TaxID=1907414 RepID=UPI000956A694|nr:hypothetical protein [Rhizobium sp. RU35A]SIQ19727.1 hypothetical protein SAMN05880590_102526 [Rhizobium sp. RU35A]
MLFGRSVFQTILTRLDAEEPDEVPEPRTPAYRIAGLGAGFVVETAGADLSDEAGHDLLAGFDLSRDREAEPPLTAPSAPALPVMPAHLARLSEAEVAEDLALTPNDTAEDLAERRRRFARLNHPDLVHPDFRDQATRRMMLANMLIDRALRFPAR